MNNSGILFTILIFLIGAFIPSPRAVSSIYGTLEPPDASDKVYAIHNKDTLTVIPQAGKFSIAVTPGNWKLYIHGLRPFKDVSIENIKVVEGKSTDAGLIHLTAE
jgi:hypothetical protein